MKPRTLIAPAFAHLPLMGAKTISRGPGTKWHIVLLAVFLILPVRALGDVAGLIAAIHTANGVDHNAPGLRPDELEALDRVKRGLADVAGGRVTPLREFKREFRTKHASPETQPKPVPRRSMNGDRASATRRTGLFR